MPTPPKTDFRFLISAPKNMYLKNTLFYMYFCPSNTHACDGDLIMTDECMAGKAAKFDRIESMPDENDLDVEEFDETVGVESMDVESSRGFDEITGDESEATKRAKDESMTDRNERIVYEENTDEVVDNGNSDESVASFFHDKNTTNSSFVQNLIGKSPDNPNLNQVFLATSLTDSHGEQEFSLVSDISYQSSAGTSESGWNVKKSFH